MDSTKPRLVGSFDIVKLNLGGDTLNPIKPRLLEDNEPFASVKKTNQSPLTHSGMSL